jgi:hypothetical protein
VLCPLAGKLLEVLSKADEFVFAWSKEAFGTEYLQDGRNAQNLASTFLALDCCLQGLVLSTMHLQPRKGSRMPVSTCPILQMLLLSVVHGSITRAVEPIYTRAVHLYADYIPQISHTNS